MRYLRSDIIQDFSRKGDITKENIAATWGYCSSVELVT